MTLTVWCRPLLSLTLPVFLQVRTLEAKTLYLWGGHRATMWTCRLTFRLVLQTRGKNKNGRLPTRLRINRCVLKVPLNVTLVCLLATLNLAIVARTIPCWGR